MNKPVAIITGASRGVGKAVAIMLAEKGWNLTLTCSNSLKEAEENCSIMAAEQLKDFLENGNIINSVNFPELVEPRKSKFRITLSNNNIAGMIGQITTILAENNLNILNMINKSKGEIAYNVIDTDSEPSNAVEEGLKKLEGAINVRVIKDE